MLDKTDIEILQLLKTNAKMQYRDIGEIVHLTGQAVSNRISRLEEFGVIKGYTVVLDEKSLGHTITAYVTVFMKTLDHEAFQLYIRQADAVQEACRISGEGCYLLKIRVTTQDDLNHFLDSILKYGNYRVNISISSIK